MSKNSGPRCTRTEIWYGRYTGIWVNDIDRVGDQRTTSIRSPVFRTPRRMKTVEPMAIFPLRLSSSPRHGIRQWRTITDYLLQFTEYDFGFATSRIGSVVIYGPWERGGIRELEGHFLRT
ncbi:hypothetical protein EG329_001518 [Mollisiaceae sp. DMI_Dod_QoI]|nr:hypothetical protein EG329_001518 [Helotiales sp. DMI_Dod_QoI]